MTASWKPILECIDKYQRFILTTHVSPDGDGIGSEIALYHYLQRRGKEVHILNPSPTSREYEFLNQDGLVQKYNPNEHRELLLEADAYIALDIGDYSRLQAVGEHMKEGGGVTICIDHHPQSGDKFDYQIIDAEAAATGMMIYHLLREIDPDSIDQMVAQALYTALMTDTGSFRFSNTTPETHKMAMELLRFGLKPHEIYKHVYESSSLARMKLLGKIITNLRFAADGKIAYFPVTLKMQEEAGAGPEDVDGFSDFIRGLADIEVAVMFHEQAPGQTRINFRSKGEIAINGIARQFDGGGHKFAAGAVIHETVETTIPMVIEALEEEVERYQNAKVREEVGK